MWPRNSAKQNERSSEDARQSDPNRKVKAKAKASTKQTQLKRFSQSLQRNRRSQSHQRNCRQGIWKQQRQQGMQQVQQQQQRSFQCLSILQHLGFIRLSGIHRRLASGRVRFHERHRQATGIGMMATCRLLGLEFLRRLRHPHHGGEHNRRTSIGSRRRKNQYFKKQVRQSQDLLRRRRRKNQYFKKQVRQCQDLLRRRRRRQCPREYRNK